MKFLLHPVRLLLLHTVRLLNTTEYTYQRFAEILKTFLNLIFGLGTYLLEVIFVVCIKNLIDNIWTFRVLLTRAITMAPTFSMAYFSKSRNNLGDMSGSFVQRQKRIAIYHVKKFVKESQLWKQTLSILPDFLENWHFLSHFVWKSTKTLKLLRIFDKIFDVINGDPFLTLYKTSATIANAESINPDRLYMVQF